MIGASPDNSDLVVNHHSITSHIQPAEMKQFSLSTRVKTALKGASQFATKTDLTFFKKDSRNIFVLKMHLVKIGNFYEIFRMDLPQ